MAKKYTGNKRKKQTKIEGSRAVVLILLLVVGFAVLRSIRRDDTKETERIELTRYGNLLDVRTSERLPEVKKSYTAMDMSFNPNAHIPNWVAWELTADEAQGSEKRKNNFRPDPDVKGCPDLADYRNSGYQRGHMAPAADMKWSAEAMDESFYLTNMCPQKGSLNGGAWGNLEDKCRLLALSEGPVYIVAGPVIDGKPIEYIGENRVYVPKKFFKVILSPYSNPARGIGFIFPNWKVEGGMQRCAVSIDDVEALTGHDFFVSLPDEIENELESQVDFDQWSKLCRQPY